MTANTEAETPLVPSLRNRTPPRDVKRVAFVSTRITGTDGVSLEIDKWARVIQWNGRERFYITGESNRSADRAVIIEEAHFNHPRDLATCI